MLGDDARAALLDEAAEALSKGSDSQASSALVRLFADLDPGRPADLTFQIFGQALARRAGHAAPNVNLYLRDLDLRQISLFNLLATHLPFVSRSVAVASRILEGALADADTVTLVDVGIGSGQQEVAVLRSLAAADRLPGRLRIVGVEPSPSILADAERAFATASAELEIDLQFTGVLALAEGLGDGDWAELRSSVGDDVIVNAAFAAHHIQSAGAGPTQARNHVFTQLRSLRPRLITLVEPNSDHLEPDFLRRYRNSWEHFGTAMRAIDASPATVTERLAMKMFFAREVDDIIANAEETRAERHERTDTWLQRLERTGFAPITGLPVPTASDGGTVDTGAGFVRIGFDGTPMVACLCAGSEGADLADAGWTELGAGVDRLEHASAPDLGGHGPALLRVRDVMQRDIATTRFGVTIGAAAALVKSTGASDLAVLDAAGQFAGVLSEGDLIRAMLPSGAGFEGSVAEGFELLAINGRARSADVIDDLVIGQPIVLDPADDLLRVASLMVDRQIRRLPVVQEGRLVGTVSRADLVAALVTD